MNIVSVVGARPNFMKIAPFMRAISEYNARSSAGSAGRIEHTLVHTGQHYDLRMSEAFFHALGILAPDINLNIGSGSHAEQVGNTMIAFEKVLQAQRPDWVVVVGDVNATCACAITAKKEGVKLAHIEAGLRSGDMSMPEEINRLVTDRLSDLLLTPDELSNANLRAEGVPEKRIRFVGNIMIDTLETHREQAAALSIADIVSANRLDQDISASSLPWGRGDPPRGFAAVTIHRPSNVDREDVLRPIIELMVYAVAPRTPIVWPIHPRTQKQLEAFDLMGLVQSCPDMVLLHPVGYHEMLKLNMQASVVLTDSGGLQEECCVLGTPCLTLRWNTERPITLREHDGASILVGNDVMQIRAAYEDVISKSRRPSRPPLWDGCTAGRIVEALIEAG